MIAASDIPFVIKICGITNEEDARIAIEAGANALGFNFYSKSPRYIAPAEAAEIVRAVPGAYLKVGIFVNAVSDELARIAREVSLDAVQLHGAECALPERNSFRVWRAMAATEPVPTMYAYEAYLLDTPTPRFGGSGRTFDWSLAAGFGHRAIVAGGLDASNVAEAIQTAHPWGVDACSRLESSPGKKDPQRVREFIRAAQIANSIWQEVSL